MSKMNPNAKPFTPKPSIPSAPPLPGKTGLSASDAGRKLDKSDARTATNKSPAHNRSQHVGKTGAQLTARNKPVATSYLTKADQNKAAQSLLTSTKGQNKVSSLKADANGKTRTITGTTPGGPGKPGATWNKTAVITKVSEKQSDGSVKVFNAKATNHQMDLSKSGGKVNVQTTYATKPKGGFTPLEKPLPKTAPRPSKPGLAFDQKDFSSVTKNAKKPTTAPTKKPGQK
jgi:hypothetical protein